MIGYAVGMAAYAFLIVALYPTFKNETNLNALTEGGSKLAALFGATGSLTSPTGWLNANIYANLFPLVVLLLTIGYGANAIAGQDEAGQLGLVATLPVSRRLLAVQKLGALALISVPVSAATLATVLTGPQFQLSVDVGKLTAVTVATMLLGIVFGGLAMLAGALSGNRGFALGISSSVAFAAYVISSLAPVVERIRSLRFVSPFYYAVGDNQLADGPGTGLLVLAVLALVVGAAAVVAVERVDLH